MPLLEAYVEALIFLLEETDKIEDPKARNTRRQSLRMRRQRLHKGEIKEGGMISLIREAFPNAKFEIDVKLNKD